MSTGTQLFFQNFVRTKDGSLRALSTPVDTRFPAHGDSINTGPTVCTQQHTLYYTCMHLLANFTSLHVAVLNTLREHDSRTLYVVMRSVLL